MTDPFSPCPSSASCHGCACSRWLGRSMGSGDDDDNSNIPRVVCKSANITSSARCVGNGESFVEGACWPEDIRVNGDARSLEQPVGFDKATTEAGDHSRAPATMCRAPVGGRAPYVPRRI
jgi:hypothetical protein